MYGLGWYLGSTVPLTVAQEEDLSFLSADPFIDDVEMERVEEIMEGAKDIVDQPVEGEAARPPVKGVEPSQPRVRKRQASPLAHAVLDELYVNGFDMHLPSTPPNEGVIRYEVSRILQRMKREKNLRQRDLVTVMQTTMILYFMPHDRFQHKYALRSKVVEQLNYQKDRDEGKHTVWDVLTHEAKERIDRWFGISSKTLKFAEDKAIRFNGDDSR
jgi:hypothetical protein